MKKMFLFPGLFSTLSFAGDFKTTAKITIDAISSEKTTTVGEASDVAKSANLDLSNAEFVIEGDASSKTSWYANIHAKSQLSYYDGAGGIEAYLAHKIMPSLIFSAGKLFVRQGSRELYRTPYGNIVYSGITAAYPSIFNTAAQVEWRLAKHSLYAQILNPDGGKRNAYGDSEGEHLGYQLAWNGYFDEGRILPIVTYGHHPHVPGKFESTGGQTLQETNHATSSWSLGSRFNYHDVELELEYTQLKKGSFEKIDDEDNPTTLVKSPGEAWQNNIVRLQYQGSWIRPFAKYAHTKAKAGELEIRDQVYLVVASEFYYDEEADVKYVIAYVNQNLEEPGLDKMREHRIVLRFAGQL